MMADDTAVTSEQVRRSTKRDAASILAKEKEDEDVAGTNNPDLTIEQVIKEETAKINKESAEKILTDINVDPTKVLMKMERNNFSWTTRSGVIFTREHPFQLVPEPEVDELIREGGFRRADPKEVVVYYNQ